ncbi:MAG: hypothetical protein WA687_01560 [Solirubrobacterales bacterium]
MSKPASNQAQGLIDVDVPYRAQARQILRTLRTYFLDMPQGDSFLPRSRFQAGFDALRRETQNGADLSSEALLRAVERHPAALVAVRTILGVTPGEMATLATREAQASGVELEISQEDARAIDAAARRGEPVLQPEATTLVGRRRHTVVIDVLTYVAPVLVQQPEPVPGSLHRLDKIDTSKGMKSLRKYLGGASVPYPDLLYERALGRPFASHRDSVSNEVGDIIDDAVEDKLASVGIPFYRTRHRERIPGFDQAPDFLIPSRNEAQVIIEDKLSEDDGTARDKVARILRLREVENRRAQAGKPARTVVAVIDGRGFRERTPDLNYMLGACNGNVFTVEMLDDLISPSGPLASFLGTA